MQLQQPCSQAYLVEFLRSVSSFFFSLPQHSLNTWLVPRVLNSSQALRLLNHYMHKDLFYRWVWKKKQHMPCGGENRKEKSKPQTLIKVFNILPELLQPLGKCVLAGVSGNKKKNTTCQVFIVYQRRDVRTSLFSLKRTFLSQLALSHQ